MPKANPVEQFLRYVSPRPDGCWLWTGAHEIYGRVNINKRTRLAHRASYELFVGPIPEGMHIDHLCRVTLCVNPDHLEAVTQRTNNARAGLGGFAKTNLEKTACVCGLPYTRTPSGKRVCKPCENIRHRRSRENRRRLGLPVH